MSLIRTDPLKDIKDTPKVSFISNILRAPPQECMYILEEIGNIFVLDHYRREVFEAHKGDFVAVYQNIDVALKIRG